MICRQKNRLPTIFILFTSFKNMHLKIIFIVLMVFLTVESQAQFWKGKKSKEHREANTQPTSLDPSPTSPQKQYAPKESRKSSKGPTYGLEQAYFERMEAVQKERRKTERLMDKPQYSDPMYFGHKRPPKKRKASKMKFCKECGIRH